MALPTPPFTGACLCGAVQVTVTAPPLLTVACHCRDCQKMTASAFSMTTMFPVDAVTITGALTRGALHSAERAHYFCANCLGFIYSTVGQDSPRINLRTMLLDKAFVFPPFAEVMTSEKLPWAHIPVRHSYADFTDAAAAFPTMLAEYAQT